MLIFVVTDNFQADVLSCSKTHLKFDLKMKTRFILFLLVLVPLVLAKKFTDEEKPDWAKKDIRDYSEADLERLLDQWEV